MRCLDEATAAALQGEAEIPISGAWACCFLVSACVSCSTTCGRSIGATGSPHSQSATAAATCSPSAAPSTAPSTCGGAVGRTRRRCCDGLDRGLLPLPPGEGRAPLVGLAELRRRQGRPARRGAAARRCGPVAGAQLCRARLALDRGEALARSSCSSGCCVRCRPTGGSIALPRSSCWSSGRIARGELEAAGAILEGLREMEAGGYRADPRVRRAGRGMLAAACGEHERARRLLEDAIDRFEVAARRSRQPGADRARHQPVGAGTRRGGRERGATAAGDPLELGAEHGPSGRGDYWRGA